MKLTITTLVIAANIFFISCKKERTCSCKTQQTTTEVTTMRSNGQSTTETSTSSGENSATLAKVKKDDLTRLYDCNSRTVKNVDTYTTSVPSQSVVSGFTMTVYVPADVVETNSTEYTCEIK